MLGLEQSPKQYSTLPKAITSKVASGIHGAFEHACRRFSNIGFEVTSAGQSKKLSLGQAFKVLQLKLVASTSDISIL